MNTTKKGLGAHRDLNPYLVPVSSLYTVIYFHDREWDMCDQVHLFASCYNHFKFVYMMSIFTGIPTLAYGLATKLLAGHYEDVKTDKGTVRIYFWYEEDKGARN